MAGWSRIGPAIRRCARYRMLLAVALAATVLAALAPASEAADGDDEAIARRLAAMLQSARSVISRHQGEINDPAAADKHLTAEVVTAEAIATYAERIGEDPAAYDPASRLGRLIAAQIAAIGEVMDEAQGTINREGVAFKGFIPATFARLVNESFARRTGGEAVVKVTAPPDLVRNRKARPDAWESAVIADRFRTPGWERGAPFAEVVAGAGAPVFRMAVPEYYAASCLSCHGGPAGTLDVTGYPREGAAENDLGGVISIILGRSGTEG